MSYSITGKTAIVTGAANGVGLAIGRHFAAKGANVMFADMDEERLIEEIGDEESLSNSNIRYFAGDLREKLTQANLLSATLDAFDRVDILVNASRQILPTDPLDVDDNSLEILLAQNLTASYRLSQVIARRMIAQERADEDETVPGGSIVNISSISANHSHPELLAYSVSTAALNQMTRSMALVLAPHQIRVNAVAFGSVMSASLQKALHEDGKKREIITACTPLGRIAAPTELAETVQFLASEAAAFTTGQILTVDGGRTLIDPVALSEH